MDSHISLNSSATSEGGASNLWLSSRPIEQRPLDALADCAGEFGRQPLACGLLQLVEDSRPRFLRIRHRSWSHRTFDRGCRGFELAGWPASFSLA